MITNRLGNTKFLNIFFFVKKSDKYLPIFFWSFKKVKGFYSKLEDQ